MRSKQTDKLNTHAMLENRELTEAELLSKVASIYGKRRWANKTDKEKSDHGKKMVMAREAKKLSTPSVADKPN